MAEAAISPTVEHILSESKQLTKAERLLLARLLLDSVLSDELEEADWSAMALETFQKDWDNPEDAIYDNWREIYGVSTR